MKKRNILFVVPSLSIGGTIVSLESLLSCMDSNKYNIDVFAMHLNQSPIRLPNCRILNESVWLSSRIVQGNIVQKCVNILINALRKILEWIGLDLYPMMGKIGGHLMSTENYDAVIAFQESLSNIVAHYPAKKRIYWVHCDYSRYINTQNREKQKKNLEKFETIVCVSQYARKVFQNIYPCFSGKTVAIHNIINQNHIIELSNEKNNLDENFKTNNFTIVSIGRIDPVKQFDAIPLIVSKIKKETSVPFRWYIIGGSRGFKEYEKNIRNNIMQYDVANEVFCLPEKANVYPYIAMSNLFVSTSLSESFPLVVNEARALNVPVVVNDFPSAHESVKDGIDGFIVNNDEMHDIIAAILERNVQINAKYESENELIIDMVESLL